MKKYLPLLWLALVPGVSLAQSDTAAVPDGLRESFDKILRMAEQAQRIFDDSLAPRPPGAIPPIPEHPEWELVAPSGKDGPPALQLVVAGSRAGSLSLEVPAAVFYLERPGPGGSRLDSLAPVAWTPGERNSAAYSGPCRGPLRLSCRVDCVGPVVNYRLDLENTGKDTLRGLQALVAVGLDALPAFSRRGPQPGGAVPAAPGNDIPGRLYLFCSGAWVCADSLMDGRRPEEAVFLPFNREAGPLARLFGGGRTATTDIRLQGNTVYLLSRDRLWRLDASASPAASFCFQPAPPRLYLNPGAASLAPGEKISVGGIISLNPAR
ncbi:MAG: hypothetical protein JXQ83_14495 [Candidatus Glassbacteria bacterium]|nr:hypothetical protein [Candidatus Glassbacteria bacterium]